MTHTGFWW